MKHDIERISKGVFKIQWQDNLDSLIMLNFNPLLDYYRLQSDIGVLEHWQAKPLYLRRWGLYDILHDEYYSCDAGKIIFSGIGKISSLQIPEKDYPDIRPTAVKLYYKAVVKVTGDNNYLVTGA